MSPALNARLEIHRFYVKGYGRLGETRDPIDGSSSRVGEPPVPGPAAPPLGSSPPPHRAWRCGSERPLCPGAHMLQTVDHDEFVRGKAARHDSQAVDFRAEFDQAGTRCGCPWSKVSTYFLDRSVPTARSSIKTLFMVFPADEAHARANRPGGCSAHRELAQRGACTNRARRRIDLVVDEVQPPRMWVAVLINEPGYRRRSPPCRARLMLRLRVGADRSAHRRRSRRKPDRLKRAWSERLATGPRGSRRVMMARDT